jgi:hypothetical protein
MLVQGNEAGELVRVFFDQTNIFPLDPVMLPRSAPKLPRAARLQAIKSRLSENSSISVSAISEEHPGTTCIKQDRAVMTVPLDVCAGIGDNAA